MRNHSLLTSCLLLLLAACSSNQPTGQTEHIIDIAGCFEQPTTVNVSQLGNNIRYVPLETTDSSLIGNSYSIQLTPEHILVSTGKSCLAFDKQNGKYIGSIGHQGEDPKGYSDAHCQVHPNGKMMYFQRRPNKLVRYDVNNHFLGEVNLPKRISQGFGYTFADSLIVAHYATELGRSEASALLYVNEQGEIKDSLPEFHYSDKAMGTDQIASISVFRQLPGNLKTSGLIYVAYQDGTMNVFPMNNSTLWRSNDNIHFRKPFNDTIHVITGNTSTPHILFHTGPWHFPIEKINQKEGTNKYVVITDVLETSQRLLFIVLQDLYDKKKTFYGIYNKKDHTTCMNESNTGLTDDLTHFMPFYPTTCTAAGEYAALLEAGKISEWMDENPSVSREGKLRFLQDLNEEANPVCVIVEP